MDKIDVLGRKFLGIAFSLGYWIILVAGIGKVIEKITKGDVVGAVKCGLSYLVAFAVMYFLPYGMDLVKEIFGG